MVQYLLEIGVDLEVRGGRGGARPINITAFRGHLDVVKLLPKAGADPYKRGVGAHMDALQWAGFKGSRFVVEYFQEEGYEFHHVHDMDCASLVAFGNA